MCAWCYLALVFRCHALIDDILKSFQIMTNVLQGPLKTANLQLNEEKLEGAGLFFASRDRPQLQQNVQTRTHKHRILGLHNLILAELTGDDFGPLQWWLAAGQLKKNADMHPSLIIFI